MSTQASSSSMAMSRLNTPFEPDMDSFYLEQDMLTPSTLSPAIGKSVPSLSQRPSLQSSSSSFNSSQSQQSFAGPSNNYELYKQQTGLPVGGLANTIAINRASGMQYMGHNSGFVMPVETLNIPLSTLDEFDFAQSQSVDMDFEADSPTDFPTMFYPSSSSSSHGQFVNPTALLGNDDSPTYSAPVQRMYPGMHSQQAAQAKAQQEQKQQEMLRQQQQRQLQGQRPLPSQSKAPAQKDPMVEESISRLLSQMRQNSVASMDDEGSTPTGSSGNGSRSRKDEEDMDEDERLLASEEGKKLSSKERRQLRNKVSARAFRSRRKEYIGQLEGEVANKAQEINDLKSQNRQLMEENTRLTDLTRMLLSSQAFSGFLSELSANGAPTASSSATSSTHAQPQPPRPQPTRKDVNPHQAARQLHSQQQPMIGMTLVPETNIDFSMLDSPTNGWNSALPTLDFQVFAMTEFPQGPSIDTLALSGKSNKSFDSTMVEDKAKAMPSIPTMPSTIVASNPEIQVSINPDVILDEQEFALYFEPAFPSISHAVEESIKHNSISLGEQAKVAIELVVRDESDAKDPMDNLKEMCASLDTTCERLALYTAHLF